MCKHPLFVPNLRETKSFLEESLMRFFQICTDSLIVCVGMFGSVKEITKFARTSLSDFTLCGAELLHKLLKQLEESLMRFFQTCTDSLIVCAGCGGMFRDVGRWGITAEWRERVCWKK